METNRSLFFFFPRHHYSGQQCRDLAGDRSNCQRFIRCFHNLRVLFTCATGTAYVPELKTCVAKDLVKDCNSTKDRVGKFSLFHRGSFIIQS